MKKIFTNLFLLATLFLASTQLSAQTYYVLSESAESKVTNWGGLKEYDLSGPGATLTFDAHKSMTTAVGNLRIDQYVNNEWKEIYSIKVGNLKKNSFSSFSCSVSSDAKKIRFCNEGSYNRTIKNIKVTMATYANDPKDKELTAPTAEVGSEGTSASTTMEWCNTPAFNLSISGKDSLQFTASISNNASAGNYGTATIKATYIHNVAGTHKATLTIKTALGTHNIALTGTTNKKPQTIAWAEALSGSDIALPMGKTITPPANAKTEITYSIADPTIISIDGNTLTALKAGTTTITATAKDNEEWLSADSTITVKVTEKKVQYIHWNDNLTRLKVGGEPVEPVLLTATAWVLKDPKTETQEENPERTPLITYASANNNIVSVSGNVLTIEGEGETILTATLPGDDVYEGVVVSTPVHVRAVSTSVCEAYALDDSKTRTLNTIDDEEYTINGPADKLTFTANREKLVGFSDGNLKVDQYYNGGWHNIFDQGVSLNDYTQYASIQLNRNATKLKFYTETGATGYKNIKDVAVTMATYLETTTPEIVVERSIIGSIIDETIRIQYSNLPDDVPVVNNSDKVTVKESGLGNVCGEYGEKELHLTIRPTEIGVIEDVITIHDEATGKKLEIPVTIHVQRNTQTILWNNADAEILTTADITFDAEAKTNITYTSSNTEVADIEDNKLIIKTAGTVTITAKAEQDNKYEAATLTKKYIISKATPAIVSLPTVEAITYGATLEAVTLNGGETDTEGTWQWNADITQVLNAGTHELAVQFIPTNTAWYNTLDSKVNVTVNKADQTIAWDFTTTEMTVDEVLTLNATATAGEVTFALTSDAATLEGNTLTAVKAGEITITASQAGNNNYNAAEEVAHTITIHKATPTVTAWPTLNDVVYGATYGEALQLVGGEASVEGAFSITNMPADLAQVPAVGEYKYGILFTPAKAESYNEVSDSVTLQVTKQLQTIAWDFADQELLIGNTLTLSATAPAGEVSFAIQPAEGVASLEGNTLTALAAGTVTITATAPENENYEAASVSYTVTVIKHTPEIITLPTVAPLGHGTALTDDMLNGGESNIEGTWSFVNPTQSLNMGNNEVAIRFTPTNTDLYNTIDATITIVVEKAETIIYWELESNILYLNDEIFLYAETANGDVITIFEITGPQGILQYDSEWMSLTAIGYGTTEVTAYYPETETHKAAELSYEITVFDPNSETTGITNTTITGKDTEKVFINGQLFIIRNNQWYDTTGKLVK